MPTLSELKERAEELCPYPIGKWRNAKFDLFSQYADSSFAPCKEIKGVVVSVMVRPPKGNPHIALVSDSGNTIPLTEDTRIPGPPDEPHGQPEQLQLL